MRAYYILLLTVITFGASLEFVTASTFSSQTKVANVASPDELQSIESAQMNGNTKRFLRKHSLDIASTEERGVQGIAKVTKAKVINSLKNWANKDRKFAQMIANGAADDLNLFAKLYSKKATPFRIFTKLQFGKLSEAQKKTNPAYETWAAYFKYWVDRNAGKVIKP